MSGAPSKGEVNLDPPPAAPTGRLGAGDAGAPSPGIMVPGSGSPTQVGNMVVVDSNRLHGRIRVPPRVRLMSPAKIASCYMRCASHVNPRWCISRAATWGRPEHRVFTPRWDWPHSRLVAAGRPQRASQFGPRQCQVGGCHSTFQCRRLRRTVVLPARMRQFCVFSFNCASRLPAFIRQAAIRVVVSFLRVQIYRDEVVVYQVQLSTLFGVFWVL